LPRKPDDRHVICGHWEKFTSEDQSARTSRIKDKKVRESDRHLKI